MTEQTHVPMIIATRKRSGRTDYRTICQHLVNSGQGEAIASMKIPETGTEFEMTIHNHARAMQEYVIHIMREKQDTT